MNEHLDEQVKARTAELEATLRELNSFSYSVAHDLRAPLRTMSSYCHLLVEDYAGKVLDDSAQDYARRVMKAAEQMDTLIQNLLAYSRLTRMEMHLESIDLDPLVTEVLSQLGDELRERKAEVAVEGPLGRVKGHRVMLVQAVSNLVSNAAKFVAPGVRPRVRVRTEAHDGKVRLSVEDNGVGVAPEFMGRIFEVFERLNRQEAYPGTGVGLAIVRRAVERMGGRTGLESKLGQGSRFWIDLPPAKEGA